MAGTVHYNFEHAQVAVPATSPVWLDVPGVTTLGITASSSVNYLAADGSKKYAAWSAPEYGFSAGMAEADFAVLAVINNGTAATTGITPGVIETFEVEATAINPQFHFSGYASNVNPNVKRAGFMVTIPYASAGAAVPAMGQETWGEWTFDGAITPNDDNVVIQYSKLETAPTFTSGVYAVTLP